MTKDTYTISQIGKEINLPPKTIRYYEEIKLISPAKRASNGYRTYTNTNKKELSLIKSARDLGLPIKEIKKLMIGCRRECCHGKETVQSELEHYIRTVSEQLNQLTNLKQKLTKLHSKIERDQCEDENQDYCCNYLKQLIEI